MRKFRVLVHRLYLILSARDAQTVQGLCLRMHAMSALSSPLHNTGHYHIGPASDLRTTGRAAAATASLPVDLANMTRRRPTNGRHNNCNESARWLLPGRFVWLLPDRNWRRIAQDRRWADYRPLDSRIKAGRVRPVGIFEAPTSWRNLKHLTARCASFDLLAAPDD